MRLITVFAGLLATLAIAKAAAADELHQQILNVHPTAGALRLENFSMSPSLDKGDLSTLTDQLQRNKIAREIAVSRVLMDASSGRIGQAMPTVKESANKILQDPVNANALILKDPYLRMMLDSYLAAGSASTQMKVPFGGSSVTDGTGHPGDVKEAGRPFNLADFKDRPLDNSPPDPGHLPFSIYFLVELRSGKNGESHCSGSLIERDLVLTARHCVMDHGTMLDGASIQVRSGNGGAVAHGAGKPWVPTLEPLQQRDGDIALMRLDSKMSQTLTKAKVGGAGTAKLWVMMLGIGVTDKGGIRFDSWNSSYISMPQPVEFNKYGGTDPDKALIPWYEWGPLATSECNGDSGGPVIVVGNDNSPVVVGVVSYGDQVSGTPAECAKAVNASFVNLGHSFISALICPALQTFGSACAASWSFVPRTLAQN